MQWSTTPVLNSAPGWVRWLSGESSRCTSLYTWVWILEPTMERENQLLKVYSGVCCGAYMVCITITITAIHNVYMNSPLPVLVWCVCSWCHRIVLSSGFSVSFLGSLSWWLRAVTKNIQSWSVPWAEEVLLTSCLCTTLGLLNFCICNWGSCLHLCFQTQGCYFSSVIILAFSKISFLIL